MNQNCLQAHGTKCQKKIVIMDVHLSLPHSCAFYAQDMNFSSQELFVYYIFICCFFG